MWYQFTVDRKHAEAAHLAVEGAPLPDRLRIPRDGLDGRSIEFSDCVKDEDEDATTDLRTRRLTIASRLLESEIPFAYNGGPQ